MSFASEGDDGVVEFCSRAEDDVESVVILV